jgi:hypothetical protein
MAHTACDLRGLSGHVGDESAGDGMLLDGEIRRQRRDAGVERDASD